MLRTKKNADGSYNENSYNASDAVNNLRWDFTENSPQWQMMQYYKGLIEFRKSCETLRLVTTSDRGQNVCMLDAQTSGATIAFTMTNPYTREVLFIVYNAAESNVNVTLPEGTWDMYINGDAAGTASTDHPEFEGLDSMLAGTATEFNASGVIDLSTIAQTKANADEFYEAITKLIRNTNADALLLNGDMIAKIQTVARVLGYKTESEEAFGKKIATIDGVALLDMKNHYTVADGAAVASEIGTILGISTQKASALCRLLVSEGKVEAKEIKVKNKGSVKQYSLVVTVTAETAEE
jgi:hypothetical protein